LAKGVKVEMKFNLSKIKLDLHKELNQAAGIVKADHFQRLESGMGVKGPLIPSKKVIEGRGGKTLVETGQMRNLLVDRATKDKQEAIIYVGDKRRYKGKNVTPAQVGAFHQEGEGNLPKREWFGFTVDIEKKILRLLELTIDREIRRA